MPWPLNVNAPLVGRLFSVSISRVDPVAAERELVIAADHVDVVGELPAVRVEVAGIGAAVADREAVAGDVDADVARQRAEDLAAEIGGA